MQPKGVLSMQPRADMFAVRDGSYGKAESPLKPGRCESGTKLLRSTELLALSVLLPCGL